MRILVMVSCMVLLSACDFKELDGLQGVVKSDVEYVQKHSDGVSLKTANLQKQIDALKGELRALKRDLKEAGVIQ